LKIEKDKALTGQQVDMEMQPAAGMEDVKMADVAFDERGLRLLLPMQLVSTIQIVDTAAFLVLFSQALILLKREMASTLFIICL